VNAQYAVNDQIRAREVRLIADNGDQIGVIPTLEARRRASLVGLDLVAINISNGVPICKILDYGKFKYDQSIKDKEAAKKNRESRVDLKEIQLRPTTDSGDLMTKAKRAGREITHVDVGASVMQEFLAALTDFKFERSPARSERQIIAIIAPAGKKTN
jgi:translation initiation factor IF-3